VRALIGSGDYFNAPLSGQVNGALALRQPGSAVKPFMYALAFDAGHGAGGIVADIPTAIPDVRGDYVPENYDRKFHGPVSIRTALACSYNVPAVRMLETIGREYFLQTLRLCGFTSLVGSSEYYGYGLTLGNAEVRLIELANAFRIFANGGMWHPWTLVKEARRADGAIVTQPVAGTPHRVYSEESAFLVTDILSDAASRAPAFGSAFRFPFSCAVKTGTTKEYKDNWTIGSTTRYTIGVWAGNFDGSEMRGVSGVAGAGAIFSDIMLLLHSAPFGLPPSEWKKPASLERVQICPRSGLPPGENCPHTTSEWFVHGHVPRARCRVHQAYRVRDEHGIASRRVYEVYGPEYAEYMERSGMTRVPQGAEPADAPLAQGSKIRRLAISSPNQGDLFKIDPSLRREYQTIRVRGFIPAGARDVRLVVDGAEERVFTEAGVVWTLEKGVHQFQLIGIINDEPLRSRVVHITVE
ncbi:MAG: penicillin-binding transpeptidase domain-containing protein, partial [Acidobacteriota bacterium]